MFIFLHIPKTGGTSFRFVLENSFGICHCHTNHTKTSVFTEADLAFAERVFLRLESMAGHNLSDPFRFSVPNPFYLTFLRETTARVISHYQDSVIRGHNPKGFEESLRENGDFQDLTVKLVAGERNLDKAKRYLEKYNFVGLTEKFDLSLHVLGRLSPRKLDLNYRKYVIRKDDKIKKALQGDSRMLELARHYNPLDVALYAFAVEEVFPRLCANAGFSPSDQVPTYDTYTSRLKPKYLAGLYYNKLFRQLYKLRHRHRAAA